MIQSLQAPCSCLLLAAALHWSGTGVHQLQELLHGVREVCVHPRDRRAEPGGHRGYGSTNESCKAPNHSRLRADVPRQEGHRAEGHHSRHARRCAAGLQLGHQDKAQGTPDARACGVLEVDQRHAAGPGHSQLSVPLGHRGALLLCCVLLVLLLVVVLLVVVLVVLLADLDGGALVQAEQQPVPANGSGTLQGSTATHTVPVRWKEQQHVQEDMCWDIVRRL